MSEPPVWTKEQLAREASRSRAAFRDNRLAETTQWTTAFDWHHKEFIRLLNEIGPGDPAKLWPAQVAEIFAKKLGDAFRYLAGPPMSPEDLRALAGASLAPGRLARDPAAARRVVETLRQRLDDRRFPWVADRRPPTASEWQAAVMASAAMMTVQTLVTGRRILKDGAQKNALSNFLVKMGYREAASRRITYLEPAPGQFCAQPLIGTRRADLALRLHDGRLMPIECEVSNNPVHGQKHLGTDLTAKVRNWRRRFGPAQIVPAAVLTGVFEVETLVMAQTAPLVLFWSHDLSALGDFVAEARG